MLHEVKLLLLLPSFLPRVSTAPRGQWVLLTDSPACDLYSLTWWKPFPFNIPQWLHEVRMAGNKPRSFSQQGGQKPQRIKIIFQIPHDKVVLDQGLAPFPGHQGRTLARRLNLTLSVMWPPFSFLRWWRSVISRDWYLVKDSPLNGNFQSVTWRNSTATLRMLPSLKRVASSGGAFGR